ncbi:DUF4352 domain-containing protein [Arthrobacter sp. ISL-5]|uniref:DUF4352 domain-containing protein n=1 Tax=Arthrobacter sp. ISL-5 TaxID=2819111 RepID=UPI001BE73C16|nr:DUF4352 domain-containing protein [Arthrobacter sp. ISL-5]MBT2555829.1 hypothetical protein [Arthrobacter sp. ISL-5]
MTHQSFEPLPPAPAMPAASKRPFYKKKLFVIPTTVVLLGIALGSCGGGGKSGSVDSSPSSPAASTAAAPAAAAQAPAAEAPATQAPAPAPAAPKAPAAPTVGKPFSVDMRNGDVAKITIVSAVRTQSVSTTAFATPPKNGSYLLLDVLWETSAGETSSNPFYFTAKDKAGRKADQNLFADNQLGSGSVMPGDKSRGLLAFDVAPGAVTVMISNPLMQEAARIQIPG